jgi:hypothetical protein
MRRTETREEKKKQLPKKAKMKTTMKMKEEKMIKIMTSVN